MRSIINTFNIFIRFGSKLDRQIVGIPMGTNCAPLVADLFLFCYERDFMLSLSDNNQADIIEAFNSTSRYLDDLLNIDNPYFEQMVGQIYPTELQLNKANSSDTEAPFLDLNLSITNGIVSSKIYDKRCLVMVERLFLAVPWGCLWFVIVVFPDHTHLLFLVRVKAKIEKNTFFGMALARIRAKIEKNTLFGRGLV